MFFEACGHCWSRRWLKPNVHLQEQHQPCHKADVLARATHTLCSGLTHPIEQSDNDPVDRESEKSEQQWSERPDEPGPGNHWLEQRGSSSSMNRSIQPLGVEAPLFINPLVSMGAKAVAHGLHKVLGQPTCAVAVDVVEGAAETRHRDTRFSSTSHNLR